MNLETFFSAANGVAMAGWLLLAAMPLRFRWPVRAARLVAVGLAFLYVALLASFWTRGEGGFGSLSQVAELFREPGLLLAGWVHYLAFDLLVGSWEREESARVGMSIWLRVPTLFLTFMFGPVGWLSFLAARRLQEARSR